MRPAPGIVAPRYQIPMPLPTWCSSDHGGVPAPPAQKATAAPLSRFARSLRSLTFCACDFFLRKNICTKSEAAERTSEARERSSHQIPMPVARARFSLTFGGPKTQEPSPQAPPAPPPPRANHPLPPPRPPPRPPLPPPRHAETTPPPSTPLCWPPQPHPSPHPTPHPSPHPTPASRRTTPPPPPTPPLGTGFPIRIPNSDPHGVILQEPLPHFVGFGRGEGGEASPFPPPPPPQTHFVGLGRGRGRGRGSACPSASLRNGLHLASEI